MAVNHEALRAIFNEALMIDERGEMTEEAFLDLERRALEATDGDAEPMHGLYDFDAGNWVETTFTPIGAPSADSQEGGTTRGD